MAKLWLGKVRALFHFILSLRIDMKKRVYQNFDTPSCEDLWAFSPLFPTNITQWQRIGFILLMLFRFHSRLWRPLGLQPAFVHAFDTLSILSKKACIKNNTFDAGPIKYYTIE